MHFISTLQHWPRYSLSAQCFLEMAPGGGEFPAIKSLEIVVLSSWKCVFSQESCTAILALSPERVVWLLVVAGLKIAF